MRTIGLITLTVLLAGCGSSDNGNGDEYECVYGSDFVAQFEKGCQTAADCVMVTQGQDCCGTSLYVGVKSSEESGFNSAWSKCPQELEQCECPPQQPHAEDGNQTANTENIQLDCQAGSCTTFIN